MSAPPVTHVLGIDQGARAGWALLDVRTQQRIASGVATKHEHIVDAVAQATWAAIDVRALLVMFEDHSGMPLSRKTRADRKHSGAPDRNPATILGMGEAKGWWTGELSRIRHPESLRDAVEPKVWRRCVLGIRKLAGDDDAYKRASVEVASRVFDADVEDHNEAEALHIARYGAITGVQLLAQRRAKQRAASQARKQKQLELEASA